MASSEGADQESINESEVTFEELRLVMVVGGVLAWTANGNPNVKNNKTNKAQTKFLII